MKTTEIAAGVHWIGVNDNDTALFEGLWPISEEGVAYNAYLVEGEKVAVIDTVKALKAGEFIDKIQEVIGDKPVDYLIVNHMEPDHSSSLAEMVRLYPQMKIVGNKKTFPIMKNFYNIDENLMEVGEGDTLDLGGRELAFYMTPMVHWPESMVTYDKKAGVLFSMDIFGSFRRTVGSIYDGDHDMAEYEMDTLRYYACIVGKVSTMAQKALQKLAPLDIQIIAPSHGLVYKDDPGYILDFYDRMSKRETEPGVVIAYGTMYGNTAHSAERLAVFLAEAGVENILMYDVAKTDISYIVGSMWKYKGFILGAPSYYGQIYPKMQNLLYKTEEIGVGGHKLGFFTDFSWSGGADRYFQKFIESTKADVVGEMVNVQGYANEEDEEKLRTLAQEMAAAIE